MADFIKCPHCGEKVRSERISCPHCGSDSQTGWKTEGEIEQFSFVVPGSNEENGVEEVLPEKIERSPEEVSVWYDSLLNLGMILFLISILFGLLFVVVGALLFSRILPWD